MHAMWIKTFAIAVALIGTGLLFGQQPAADPTQKPADTSTGVTGQPVKPAADKPAPPKTKLEEMLQQAMRNNPDIRVAEAKMAEAEAQLNRTRLVVMQKVVLYNAKLDDAKMKVELAEKSVKRLRTLAGTGAVSATDMDTAEAALQNAKAEQAKVEAELPLLLGSASDNKTQVNNALEYLRRYSLDTTGDPNMWRVLNNFQNYNAPNPIGPWQYQTTDQSPYTNITAGSYLRSAPTPVQGPMADCIKKALDKSIKVQLSGNPRVVLTNLLDMVEGVSFNIRLTDPEISDKAIDLDFRNEMPLGAAFQALQDVCLPSVRFVVRDYGILVTDEKHLPPGAALLYDVWKGAKDAKDKGKPDKTGLFPAGTIEGQIEGKVKAVDSKGLLVSIDIGSNAGLKTDDKLTVVRVGSPSKISSGIYAGTVKVVKAMPDEAVCHIESQITSPDQLPKVGDIVTYLPPAK
jgi:hypothetical protein